MKGIRKMGLLFSMAILIATFSSSARADDFDKLTIFSFSAPVELPGDVVLSSGTYIFKLLDIPGNRNIVQVLDQEQTQVYATNFTVPTERPRPTDNTVVEFYETADGPQNALKAWFYPGDTSGREFVYSRSRAAELADTAKQTITVTTSNLTSSQVHP
ncbi:MAG TPA: hypothetical protein VFE02_06270 [Candidatus Acidoferrales bacterium]|nr:hypothetical protein [Candidatus Acidoferrales bacterium]